ncbi:MAG: ribonuclease HII [Candidatus Roseilinea sp.]|nr:MAG: ribonuclease HII [Candidatus Roseilinea sp.]
MPIVHQRSPSLREERALQRAGHRLIAGVDEAGRGAWAGPVVAAAVILPFDRRTSALLRGVNDSKQLTPAQRVALRERIERVALDCSVGSASSAEVDALGIVAATRLAMMRAVVGLRLAPDALLIDAVALPELPVVQHAFDHADAISLSVAAASILAKTARDAIMCALDASAVGYGFAGHKGYGTRAHAEALARLGPCWAHRRTFKPVASLRSRLLTTTL